MIGVRFLSITGEGTLLVELDYYNADFTFSNRSTKTSHVWRKLNGGQFSCDVIMETRLCTAFRPSTLKVNHEAKAESRLKFRLGLHS